MEALPDARVDEASAQVAAAIDPVALAGRVGEVILAAIPEVGRSADEDLRLSIVATATQALAEVWDRVLGAGTAPITPQAPAIALAHELVHRGIGLAALLRAYRLGHQVAEERWIAAAEELGLDPEVRWRVLSRASHVFFDYVDAVSSQLAETYAEERARWARGAAAARAELVTALLAGEAADAGQATRTLDYDVARRHVAFVVWSDPRAPGGSPANLELVAAGLARELGGGPPLVVPVGRSVVWGWTSGADAPRDGPLRVADGAWAALGSPGEGVEGFVRSHHEAQAARRVAGLLGPRPGTVVREEAVALLALLTSDRDAARRFAEKELGALMEPTDAMARLRATLRVYTEESSSPARTSRRLGVHQNTVVYRVNRAEEILGRPLAERRLEIEVALRLADALPGAGPASGVAGGPGAAERP